MLIKQNKLKVLILILTGYFVLCIGLQAQAPNFEWTKQAGGSSYDFGWGITTDGSGNIVVIGHFFGTTSFDSFDLTSTGSENFSDIFIAKYDPAGNVLWAKQAGGLMYDYGRDIATDDSDNIVVTGRFQIAVNFDSLELMGIGNDDIFIAKYDPAGNVLWAKQAGGSRYDYGIGIATDGSDNILLTGRFQGTASFDSIDLTSIGSGDIFIAKYDPAGSVLWAKQAGVSDEGYGHGIAADYSGNIVVTGYFVGTVNFGDITLTNTGYGDIFIAKYDPSGNVLWAKQAGGSNFEQGNDIATDSSGNIAVTGDFHGTASFDSFDLTSIGINDIFIAKYDPFGDVLWVKQAGGESNSDQGRGIATDGLGNIVVTGDFHSTASFDSFDLTSNGGGDIFIAKYDPSGNVLWAKQAGGESKYDHGRGIATDNSANIMVTGEFQSTASFDSLDLTSIGNDDIFVSKLPGTPVPLEINVTLQLNTSTNPDTLQEYHFVQVRGRVNGQSSTILPDGKTISWDSNSDLIMQNMGGDYWEVHFKIKPGDVLRYRYWTGFDSEQGTCFNDGWEEHLNPIDELEGFERSFIAGNADITLPLEYYNGSDETQDQYWRPFETKTDFIAVYFRVNLGGVAATGRFNPDVNGPVSMRGNKNTCGGVLDWNTTKISLTREMNSVNNGSFWSGIVYIPISQITINMEQQYKFFIEHDTEDGLENSIPDRTFIFTQSLVNSTIDTTLHWSYFDDVSPFSTSVPEAETSGEITPIDFKLYPNTPNPFNAETTISYHLPYSSDVTLTIYDLQGHEIRRLVHETKSPGYHIAPWDGQNDGDRMVASSMYLYRIEMNPKDSRQQPYVDVRKMLLIK